MRTVLIIGGGILLWALGAFAARRSGSTISATTVLWSFAVVWLLVAAGNMWVGVSQAGYTVREEFPIFLAIFMIPVVVALMLQRRFF